MTDTLTNAASHPTAAAPLPRLLPPRPLLSLHAHDADYGLNPPGSKALIAEVERSGLRGRGGAGFPTATKLAAVGRGRRTVVVVNATEGEPASRKDALLSSLAPHLILDGAVLAAGAVGATEVHVCVERRGEGANDGLVRAVEERARAKRDKVTVRLHEAPNRYVAGEESALVNWLNGGEAKPTFVPPRPFERGVRGRPTLVQNAETLAHIALIARRGAAWFRELGTQQEPGTALVTVAGAVARPGVCEVPIGYPLVDVLGAAGTAMNEVSAVLVGGYFGTWLSPKAAARTTYDRASLGAVEASPGCGVVAALSRDACGLLDLARASPAGSGTRTRTVRPLRQRPSGNRRRRRSSLHRRSQRWCRTPASPLVGDGAGAGRMQAPGWGGALRGQRSSDLRRRHRTASPPRPVPLTASGPAGARDWGMAMSIRTRLPLVEEHLAVNPITCVGHGLCAELFPEWITLDDWGYPIIDPHPIPRRFRLHAERAIEACPTLALLLRTRMPPPQ